MMVNIKNMQNKQYHFHVNFTCPQKSWPIEACLAGDHEREVR